MKLNSKIQLVILAVQAYKKFICYNNELKGNKQDWYNSCKVYYNSLDLPEGLKKNKYWFEAVINYPIEKTVDVQENELNQFPFPYAITEYTSDELVKEFELLNSIYGSREEMDYISHRRYVSKCFEIYEKGGFTKRFKTPYNDKKKYNGYSFKVIKRLEEVSDKNPEGADLECLPMWLIEFPTGKQISAFPEEICQLEMKGE